MSDHPYQALEIAIGHRFKNKNLLEDALTHSSTGLDKNYERLEFLGDRVLGLIMAELLYSRFPEEREGDLAKRQAALVQGSLLAEIAREIDLGRFVEFSQAEREAGGGENINILADVFEAVIGAMYLDGGFEICRTLVERCWASRLYQMKAPPQHPKTRLQEWAQSRGLPLPIYKIAGQSGPDHAPLFDVALSVAGFDDVVVQGRSRQAAEKLAAEAFITLHEDKMK